MSVVSCASAAQREALRAQGCPLQRCVSCCQLPALRSWACCRYVEEQDLLALALNGRYRAQTVPLLCQRPPPKTTNNLERIRSAAERHFPISQ